MSDAKQDESLDVFLGKLILVDKRGYDYPQKGILERYDSSFLFLKTFTNIVAISRADIVQIKIAEVRGNG